MGFWIVAVIVLLMIVVFVRRGLQMKELAHNGVVGQAKVIQKQRRHSNKSRQSTAYLKYQFDAPNGLSHTNRIAVTDEIFSRYEEGDSIDIVYLENKPGVSGARYMVNLSRQALKLPPL
jgi:hypothetical protein